MIVDLLALLFNVHLSEIILLALMYSITVISLSIHNINDSQLTFIELINQHTEFIKFIEKMNSQRIDQLFENNSTFNL